MTYKSITKVLAMAIGLSSQTMATYAADMPMTAMQTDRYALPRNKSQLESCKQNAMFLHAGTIETQQTLHRRGDFWVRYNIKSGDGSEWFSLCNLASGQIVFEQKLVDDAF
ncbi:MAG: hypothetical protein ACXWF8_05430 [Methylobacter sp.]